MREVYPALPQEYNPEFRIRGLTRVTFQRRLILLRLIVLRSLRRLLVCIGKVIPNEVSQGCDQRR